MQVSKSSHIKRALILLAPLLAAPSGQSCFAPVHGISATPCHPGALEGCPGNDIFSLQVSEDRLKQAETTSVLWLAVLCIAQRCEACR